MKSNQPVNYICYHCQKQCTRGDPSLIRAAGRLYHKQCFQCDSCGVSVLDKFYLTSEMILCEKDYYRCRQCQQRITDASQLQEFGDYKYHSECLICPGCTVIPIPHDIPQSDYYDYNGRLYCQYHYSLIKGVECIGCRQAVFNQENHPEIEDIWHTECFMIYKYWQISLSPPQQHDYTDKNHYLFLQKQHALKRQRIWKTLCQFEQDSSTIIKNILISQLHSNCYQLIHHIHTLFQTLDYLYLLSLDHQQRKDPKSVQSKAFKDGLDFQYQKPVQLLMDQVISFFHILGETQNRFEKEFMVKMAKLISQYIRELVRLSLQQALVLESKESQVMDQVLHLYSQEKQRLVSECLGGAIQLLEMTLKEQKDKSTFMTTNTPSPFLSGNKTMSGGSTPTLHLYSSQPTPIQRSFSTRHEPRPGLTPHTTSTSRIETLKRALTTHRKTSETKKSLSVNNPPLFISLPAIPLPTSSSPPLSPPSAVQHHQHVWTMPLYLPELNLTQDAILRHTALLFIERYTDEPFLPEDYWVETTKSVPVQSLWGKLKAHILTPNGSHTLDFPHPDPGEPRRIGVALYHLPSRALTLSETPQDDALAAWIRQSPSVASCFSSRAQIPNFLKDCILCMINQDLSTEGIFRKNGNIRTLKDMCLALDQQCETEGGWRDFFSHQPIIQLAAFIKRFTRELPEPLLTFKLHKLFLVPQALHHALCLLPKPNRDTLFLILALLHWVADKSEANRMDIDNLARVMTPNLLYPSKKSLQQLDTYGPEIQVVTTLIQDYARLMEVPSDMLHLLENPKLTEHVFSNNIDLTSTKQFTKHFHSLLSIKKDIIQEPLMPPSPSVSSNTFK